MVDTILDDPEMPENTRIRFLNRAQAQTDRLSNLVTDLLVLSRLETTDSGGRPTTSQPEIADRSKHAEPGANRRRTRHCLTG